MSETPWTPGPWDEQYVYEAVRHIARNCTDLIEGDDPEFGWDRYKDHRLIAAAPEMAELLDEFACDVGGTDQVCCKALALLARIRGKTS